MDAMKYEYILQKIYKSGRDYENGADATIYRKLERAQHILEIENKARAKKQRGIRSDALSDLEYDVRSSAAAVSRNLGTGLRYLVKNHHFKDTETAQRKTLESLANQLDMQYDKKEIDRIMDEIEKTMSELGLKKL